jgi:hypothetical protein
MATAIDDVHTPLPVTQKVQDVIKTYRPSRVSYQTQVVDY